MAARNAWVAAFAAAGLVAVLSINAKAANQEKGQPSSVAGRDAWPRVQVPDPVARSATREALGRTQGLLSQPRCRSVLTRFADREGHALANRLDTLGVDVQTYLTMIVFVDDARHRACADGVIGFTRPGSRVVYLCSNELKRTWQQNPKYVIAALIHELLHSLGLGENPPSTQEITRGVMERCREE